MSKRLAMILIALGLTACQTAPTAFAPAPGPSGLGYSDLKIEQSRYRVTWRGVDHPRAPAEDLALLHAADLALANGFDWFRVIDRSDSVRASNGPTIGLGTGSTSFGRSSAVGIGIGTSFDLSGAPVRTVSLEVLMGTGTAPRDRDTYDARDAASTIRSRL